MRSAGAFALVACAVITSRAQAPLPDRDAFLNATRENLARSQQLAHHYAYKERRADFHMNPFGRMGKGETRVLQVFPAPNRQLIYRRVIERDGRPVPADDLARQDAEYRSRAEQVLRRLSRERTEDRSLRERDETLARHRAQMTIADVVNTLKFEIARREMRDGVPAIVVTFVPRPDARPNMREGKIARVFEGTIWIHEAAREVMHVEAHAIDDASFGGFIAKLYEGTRATIVRREIEQGVWMPTLIKLNGEARALFRKVKVDFMVEWFDYEKLPNPNIQIPSAQF